MPKLPGWVKPHPIGLRDGALLGVFLGLTILFGRLEFWWICGGWGVFVIVTLLADHSTWFNRVVTERLRK